MKITRKNLHTYLIQLSNGKEIKIPSQKYPVKGIPIIFDRDNTEPINDERIKTIFDGFDPKIGRCYDNSDRLYQQLIQSGIEPKRLKIYVGWLFIFGGEPIHHSMVVVDDKHILDHGVFSYFDKYSNLADFSKRDKDDELVQRLKEDLNGKTHSQTRTFGKGFKSLIYIVSVGTGAEGIQIRNKLLKAHPKHSGFVPENESNLTNLQSKYNQQ